MVVVERVFSVRELKKLKRLSDKLINLKLIIDKENVNPKISDHVL